MADYITMGVAFAGLGLSIFNTVKPLYAGRYRLGVDVIWEYSEREPDDSSSPHVTIRNTGGRVAYVSEIYLVEADGTRNLIGDLGSRKIEAHDKTEFRPDWSEPFDDDPRFRHGWRGLRVVVRDAGGREWQSDTPESRPSWFHIEQSAVWDFPGITRAIGPVDQSEIHKKA